ncbi:hypothetical protein [Sphingopyxis sp. R3-92]
MALLIREITTHEIAVEAMAIEILFQRGPINLDCRLAKHLRNASM